MHDVRRSLVFDQYRGTNFWPTEYDGRGIINETFNDVVAGVLEDTIQERYEAAKEKLDWSRLTAFAYVLPLF